MTRARAEVRAILCLADGESACVNESARRKLSAVLTRLSDLVAQQTEDGMLEVRTRDGKPVRVLNGNPTTAKP